MEEKVGRISEQLGEGNYNRNILYEKTPFSIKGEKKKKEVLWLGLSSGVENLPRMHRALGSLLSCTIDK